MIFYKNLLIVIALVVSFYIIFLVRKSKLHIMQLFWWLIVIFSLLLFGIFPSLIDSVGHFLEIGYPPILIVVLAYVFLLIKLIHMDKYITENEIRIKELVQKIAILENEVHEKNIKEAKYEENNNN